MRKVILKFGLYSALSLVVLFLLAYLFESGLSYGAQEVIGYLSMLVALAFVFFGVKSYRDDHLAGKIGFGRALGVGMLIVLIPSIAFGLYNAIYVTYIAPDFMENYYAQAVADVTAQYSGEELATELANMESMKELATSTLFGSLLMFATVLILGFIVSLITAVTLRKA